jgi:hypothetical protein
MPQILLQVDVGGHRALKEQDRNHPKAETQKSFPQLHDFGSN